MHVFPNTMYYQRCSCGYCYGFTLNDIVTIIMCSFLVTNKSALHVRLPLGLFVSQEATVNFLFPGEMIHILLRAKPHSENLTHRSSSHIELSPT